LKKHWTVLNPDTKLGKCVINLFALGVVGSLVWYVLQNWSVFRSILDASHFHLIALALLSIVGILLNGIQSFFLLRVLGVKIGFWENEALTIASVMCNYAPLRPGTIIRINYLKHVHGLDYVGFGALISMRFLTLVVSTTFLGCIGLFGSWWNNQNVHPALAGLLIGGLICSGSLILFRSQEPAKPRSGFLKWWSRFYRDFRSMQAKPGVLGFLVAVSFLHCITLSLRLVIAYDAIRVDLSFWVALILAPSVSILSFLTITPGNLGLREWGLGLFSYSTGYDFRNGVFAGTLDRAIAMACTFLLGSIAIIYVWIKTKRAKVASIE